MLSPNKCGCYGAQNPPHENWQIYIFDVDHLDGHLILGKETPVEGRLG